MSEAAPSVGFVLPGLARSGNLAIHTTVMPAELAAMLEDLERRLDGQAPTREQWLDALKSVRFVCADLQELIDGGAFGCTCSYGVAGEDDGGEDEDGGGGQTLPPFIAEACRTPSDRKDDE